MRNLLNNFLRGLLLIVPMAAAIYAGWYLYNFLDSLIPIAKNIPGLSFVIVIVTITIIGSFTKKYNTGLINWFEELVKKYQFIFHTLIILVVMFLYLTRKILLLFLTHPLRL